MEQTGNYKNTSKTIKQKTIKTNIKNQIINKNIGIIILSKKANINIYKLVFLLYFPFSKIRLTQSIKICKALNLNVSDIII